MKSKMFNYASGVVLVLGLICGLKGDEFDYEHQAKWYDEYQQCSMNRQSPIELNSNDAVLSYDILPIEFAYYDTPYSLPAKAENNGHTANVQLPKPKMYQTNLWQIYDKISPHITGGQLPAGERFVAESVHFHWGSKDSHGSEHVIDSERFSMEMHIVHRNSKYPNVEEAREHTDGLTVLAVLYTVDLNLTDDGFHGLDRVINALESISAFNKTAEIEDFNLSVLMGDLDRTEFYTYEGSLTTPPCSQAVNWFVFSHVIPISHRQMNRFHELTDGHGAVLENNYRSLQAKGNRKVYLRHKRKVIESVIQSPAFWDFLSKLKPELYEEEEEKEKQSEQPVVVASSDNNKV